jgi:allophanate hydrolase
VLQSAQGFDAEDAYSRQAPSNGMQNLGKHFKFGVPRPDQLAFFGNPETPQLFQQAIRKLESIGGTAVELDFSPFLETARLLYEGPWVAERYAAIQTFFEAKPEAIFPVTKKIIGNATKFSATDTYNAMYKLKALQRSAEAVWREVDVMATPTAGTIYTIAEVEADPIQTNTNLGYYTNFMNLLDMAASAVPIGFQSNGLPFGITVFAPAFSDGALLRLAEKLEKT